MKEIVWIDEKMNMCFIWYRGHMSISMLPFSKKAMNSRKKIASNELCMDWIFEEEEPDFLANELTTEKSFTNEKCRNHNFGWALGIRQRLQALVTWNAVYICARYLCIQRVFFRVNIWKLFEYSGRIPVSMICMLTK